MTTISQLITRHDGLIAPSASLAEAAEMMLGKHLSSVIVVDQAQVVGIVTESDVLHAIRGHRALSMAVSEIMTSPVHAVPADTDFREAYRAAARLGIRHIVVTEADGLPVGVVSETEFRQHLGIDFFRHLNNVDHLMERLFPRLPADAPLDSALAAMEAARASCVVVVEARKPVGIVTQHDIVRLFLSQQDNPRIGQIMTPAPLTVRENTTLAEAARLMNERGIRHLVVVNIDGHVVGLLSEHTLMRPLENELSEETFSEQRSRQRKLDEALLTRNAALSGLIRGEPLVGVLELISLSVEAEVPGWRCVIMTADAAGQTLQLGAAPRMSDAYCRHAQRLQVGEGIELCGTAAHRRVDLLVENVLDDPRWQHLHELARQENFSACFAQPVLGSAGELLGTLSIFHAQPARPDKSQINLVTQATRLTALVLTHRLGEQRLQDSLATFRGMFDNISEALFIQRSNGIFVDANQQAEQMFGYTKDELRNHDHRLLSAPGQQDVAAVNAAIDAASAGQPQHFEFWGRHRDGHIFPIEVFLHPGQYFGQQVLIASARDIGARKLAEEKQKLAASVFANAHEGIMITDAFGRIVEVNSTFSDLTGYTRDEAIGQNAGILNSGRHDAAFYRDMWQTIRDQGFWRGEIWNRKKCGEIFVEQLTISTVRDDRGAISHFVGIFSDITLLKQHQQRLEHLAHFDALTQLPNRMLLADRLQLAMAQNSRSHKLLAVCYLDLDGFKPINDTYGHATGDQLLIAVAQRLKACVRAGDTVSRLGGDEFVLLLGDLNDLHECDQAINRIIRSLTQPIQLDDHQVSISASIGATLYPEDGADADTLLRHADQAMYVAKQAGRNRYHLFDPESDRQARVRREEIERIREALDRQEFRLYFQPKVDMRQGRVIGAEALIRWQHPEEGLLLPDRFLPAIDGSELAIEVGDWVIGNALDQLSEWIGRGLNIGVSINIAGNHLLHEGFARRLGEHLAAHPLVPPERVELEVLETAALEDIGQVARLFADCRALGVRFALDDFGTGYSSLTYFRRLPANILKIDQSFVRNMLDDTDDLAIVEGVIGLTQAFQREVIAEGVETVEHGLVLLLLGCDMAQGFGIARPMPGDQLPGWIEHFQPDPLWSAALAFEWARDDFPLLIAEAEHRRWVRNLRQALNEAPDNRKTPLAGDHHECGFGRWYYSPQSSRYQHVAAMSEIERVHTDLHKIGQNMLNLHHAGNLAGVDALRPTLEATSVALTDLIQQIQAEILISGQSGKR